MVAKPNYEKTTFQESWSPDIREFLDWFSGDMIRTFIA